MPSAFTLELPPYRRPQVLRVLIRSVLDRTLFVLGRAVIIAIPAGLLIWTLANVSPGGISLLSRFSSFLDPLGRLMGMDGVILTAFILGWPANEIVLPIILMCYLSAGTLTDYENLTNLHQILTANGWTLTTALCTMTFCLFHWPCSTTCLTIKKETGSLRWTIAAFLDSGPDRNAALHYRRSCLPSDRAGLEPCIFPARHRAIQFPPALFLIICQKFFYTDQILMV